MERIRVVHIAYFGAFDLVSFGDAMFPVVFRLEMEERFGSALRLDLYAPSGSAQPYNHLPPVYALDDLEENHKKQPYDALVIGGGELIHFQPISYHLADGAEKMYPSGEFWQRPGRIAKKLDIPVLWSCVGVSRDFLTAGEIEQIREACARLCYLSVRDEYSRIRLENMAGIKGVRKIPDMLWLLRKHYRPQRLQECLAQLKMEYGFLDGDYLVLQYGTSMEYQKLAIQVWEISKACELDVVLLTVNGCHEDQASAEKLWEVCRQFHRIPRQLQPEEILAVIAGARFFLGTSLHGNIAAMSYGVKNLCLDMYPSHVSKVDGLFEMLQRQDLIVYDTVSVRDRFEQLADTGEYGSAADRIVVLQKQLTDHFNNMADLIQNGGTETCGRRDVYLPGMRLVKGVLRNGRCCAGAVSVMEGCLNLRFCFQIKQTDGKYEGSFFYPVPFAVDKIDVLENGKPVKVKLTIGNGQTEHPWIWKDQCEYFVRSSEEAGKDCRIEVHIQIRETPKWYMDRLERKIQDAAQELLNKQGHIELLMQSERELQQDIANKQGHIEMLLESERELEMLKTSRTWRLAAGMQKLSLLAAPIGSLRRLFLKMGLRMLRSPKQSVRMLSPRKIRHFFRYLQEEGAGFVSERIDASMQGVSLARMDLAVDSRMEEKKFEEYEPLFFDQVQNPEVSIIIPVFNQFVYTYHCLKAIWKNTKDAVSYEVIVADDCSTDDTVRLGELAHNIRILTNNQNLRFLKNCNQAAGKARGKYLVFLNNDTQVQEHWLKPLTDLMESRKEIGMAGAKLVYADGRLQEAGGIIWNDGSAWNYGHGQDPQRPEYNYVKEVDYISGAAIMIRASLWKEIGGFDERYTPAYYEDTDLACEVRRLGYLVVYQPLSVVVHFEGISNGTDVSDGQKSFQEVNRKKFYEKWKDVLMKEQFQNGEHVFLARDRSAGKKLLLVADHYVPTYDKDAGSRCTFDYLKLFVRMGYHVRFIPDNFYKNEPYTLRLQQMGIEVLYGDYYFHHWKEWIRANGKYFDYAWLSRPHISVRYIDLIRTYSSAKIIYFGHDLHYLREMRAYQQNGDEKNLKDSKEWKRMELELMRKADVSYYLSKAELDEIAGEDVSLRVRRVPIHIYDRFPKIHYQAAKRKDILFVGGFGHPPNADAVRWLAEEIMPLVWKKNEDMVLHVVGSGPPKDIQAFANEHLKICGFLTDEELRRMYAAVRLAVVPLRFGAGIKGKIIEAMMWGIPVVTTEIGIEGIEGAEQIIQVHQDTQELADCMVQLYQNECQLEQMSEEERRYIKANYSVKNAVDVLREDFEFDSYDIP